LNQRPEATDLAAAGDEGSDVNGKAVSLPPPADANANNFEQIYAENFGFVWRCLRAMAVPQRSLDDACQEVFLALYRSLSSFREDSSLRTYLYGIVRNVAFKQRRTAARKERAEELTRDPMGTMATPEVQAQDAQAAAFVQKFVSALDDKKRDVFVLALLEELSIPEVASIIDVPVNTAYTRLRAVKSEFREALERARHSEAT
jgi:RNA polymerase sigma-70 factor (ECF subfamily)